MGVAFDVERNLGLIFFVWRRESNVIHLSEWLELNLVVWNCWLEFNITFLLLGRSWTSCFLLGESGLFSFLFIRRNRNVSILFNGGLQTSPFWLTLYTLLFLAWGDAVSRLKADVFITQLTDFILNARCRWSLHFGTPLFDPGDSSFQTMSV